MQKHDRQWRSFDERSVGVFYKWGLFLNQAEIRKMFSQVTNSYCIEMCDSGL